MQEFDTLSRELRNSVGARDVAHLVRMERWGRACTVLGYATAWLTPNPISALLIALGRTNRFSLGHQILHGGYDRIPGVPKRYTSAVFGRGWRRFIDWFDWWKPEAWAHIHNHLHHRFTGSADDPDLVEPALGGKLSRFLLFFVVACTWRWSYYAFYAQSTLARQRQKRAFGDRLVEEGRHFGALEAAGTISTFAIFQFVLVPLLFFPLGMWAVFSVWVNVVVADLVNGFQTFLCNRTSHVGDDLCLFEGRARSREEWVVRQLLTTTNFSVRGDLLGFLHLWSNYQIEHHIWPSVPLLKYQEYHAPLRKLCERHGLPWVQESVWKRLNRLYRVTMGHAAMLLADTSCIKPVSR